DARTAVRRRRGAGFPGAAGRPSHEERVPPAERERMDLCAPGGRSGGPRISAWLFARAGDPRCAAGNRARAYAGYETKLEILPRRREERALAAHRATVSRGVGGHRRRPARAWSQARRL